MPARDAASRTISHNTFGVIPLPQTRPALLIDRKRVPSRDAACFLPYIDGRLDPSWNGNGTNVSSLAQEVGDDPVLLSRLDRIEAEREQLAAAKSTSDQHGED